MENKVVLHKKSDIVIYLKSFVYLKKDMQELVETIDGLEDFDSRYNNLIIKTANSIFLRSQSMTPLQPRDFIADAIITDFLGISYKQKYVTEADIVFGE